MKIWRCRGAGLAEPSLLRASGLGLRLPSKPLVLALLHSAIQAQLSDESRDMWEMRLVVRARESRRRHRSPIHSWLRSPWFSISGASKREA